MTNLDDLMYASKEDQEFYLKCVEGLPMINGFSMNGRDSNGVPMCYGTGSHSVRCLREFIEYVKPTSIIEIGLNCGYGSAMMLNLCDAEVLSVDISDRAETLRAGNLLHERYGDRFHYVICDSGELTKKEYWILNKKFSMAFVDGAHDESSVVKDIALCMTLGIKYLMMDDWLPQFGEVQEAVKHFPKLKVVKVLGNISFAGKHFCIMTKEEMMNA